MQQGHGHTSTHKIHIILTGNAVTLCGEPHGVPTKWPDGHLYATVPPHQTPPPVVNCPECLERYNRRWRG